MTTRLTTCLAVVSISAAVAACSAPAGDDGRPSATSEPSDTTMPTSDPEALVSVRERLTQRTQDLWAGYALRGGRYDLVVRCVGAATTATATWRIGEVARGSVPVRCAPDGRTSVVPVDLRRWAPGASLHLVALEGREVMLALREHPGAGTMGS